MLNKYTWRMYFGSLLVHGALGAGLIYMAYRTPVSPMSMAPIKLKIAYMPKPETKVVEQLPAPKVKPLPKVAKKMAPPKSERKPAATPTPDAMPIQGLSASTLTAGAHGIAVPIGNTLLREDEGKRLKAEDVKDLEQDLSTEASLIHSTFSKPTYSQTALFAQLTGMFAVLVFVDKEGNALDVELPKTIGYDMDDPIKKAVLLAKYFPKKDKSGQAQDGWTEIKVKLEIP